MDHSRFTLPELQRPVQQTDDVEVIKTPIWSYCTRDFSFPDGRTRTFHTIRKGPGVTIVPWSSYGEDLSPLEHRLLMIPQVRPNADGAVGWCFAAGGMDPVDNGDPTACGERELLEEAGLLAKSVVNLGVEYTSVHFSDNLNHTVLAFGLTQVDAQVDIGEVIGDFAEFTIGEIFAMTEAIGPEGKPYFYDGISMTGLGKVLHFIMTH